MLPPSSGVTAIIASIAASKDEMMGQRVGSGERGGQRFHLPAAGFASKRAAYAACVLMRVVDAVPVGERNSCTTLVTDIFARNFEKSLSCEDKPCIKGGMPWKHSHMRDADIQQQDTTLNILVTRHACPPQNQNQQPACDGGCEVCRVHDASRLASAGVDAGCASQAGIRVARHDV